MGSAESKFLEKVEKHNNKHKDDLCSCGQKMYKECTLKYYENDDFDFDKKINCKVLKKQHCEICHTYCDVSVHADYGFFNNGVEKLSSFCHCCKCKTVVGENINHCGECCATYSANKKHCCKCNKFYDRLIEKHCCACNCVYNTSFSKRENHCCKCKLVYRGNHCCECKMVFSDYHCCKCKVAWKISHKCENKIAK